MSRPDKLSASRKPKGFYKVKASTESGKPVVSAAGAGGIQSGIRVLRAKFDVSNMYPGRYLLGIGQPGIDCRGYPRCGRRAAHLIWGLNNQLMATSSFLSVSIRLGDAEGWNESVYGLWELLCCRSACAHLFGA